MTAILLIEDDRALRTGMAFSFERDGYRVYCADTVAAGQALFARHKIDLIVLDLNLPDGDGVHFCAYVRAASRVPIIMLTARDLEADELAGLSAGADDYITKPFSIAILRARAANLLRRLDEADIVRVGAFTLDTNLVKFYRGEEEIPISPTEFRLLKLFLSHAGKILPKAQIAAALWEGQTDYVDDNALSVNISRLRAKVEANAKKPSIIKTVHGLGYGWIGC